MNSTNNIFKKSCLFGIVFLSFQLSAQNYSDNSKDIQHTYYSTEYAAHLPIKNTILYITHEQMLDLVKQYDKALVYVFVNGCKSQYCKPMYVYENWCKENGYTFLPVMVSNSKFQLTTNQMPNSQLFCIRQDAYKGLLRAFTYRKHFENGLLRRELKAQDLYRSYYLYNQGQLIGSASEELPSKEVLQKMERFLDEYHSYKN